MKKRYSLLESFSFAWRGIFKAFKKERNLKIHLLAAILAVSTGLLLKISRLEWLVLTLVIALVMAGEIFNSSIEAGCNLIKQKLSLSYYETYWIRNFAAGAVMVLALAAFIIGLLIFLPRLF